MSRYRNERSGGGMTEVGPLMAAMLQQRGGAELLQRLELERIWPDIVGTALARQSRPEAVDGGCLTIVVPNPTWNNTLQTMQRKILSKIRERCPGLQVERLRIVLGRPPAAAAPSPAPAPALPAPGELDQVALPPAAQQRIAATAAGVEDEALREQVVATMTRQFQLLQWRLAHGWRVDDSGDVVPPDPVAPKPGAAKPAAAAKPGAAKPAAAAKPGGSRGATGRRRSER